MDKVMKNKSGLKPVALQITTQVQKNPLLVMYDLSKFCDVIESIFLCYSKYRIWLIMQTSSGYDE